MASPSISSGGTATHSVHGSSRMRRRSCPRDPDAPCARSISQVVEPRRCQGCRGPRRDRGRDGGPRCRRGGTGRMHGCGGRSSDSRRRSDGSRRPERRPQRQPPPSPISAGRDIRACPGLERGHTDEDRHAQHDRDGTTPRPSERLGRWTYPGFSAAMIRQRYAGRGCSARALRACRRPPSHDNSSRRTRTIGPAPRRRFDIEEGSCVPRDPFRGLARRGSAATILASGAAAGWWVGGRSSRHLMASSRRSCSRGCWHCRARPSE